MSTATVSNVVTLVRECDVHSVNSGGTLKVRLWLVPFELSDNDPLSEVYEQSRELCNGSYDDADRAAKLVAGALQHLGITVCHRDAVND